MMTDLEEKRISFLEESVRNLTKAVLRLEKRIEDLERERRPTDAVSAKYIDGVPVG